jgi:hypothetical protein
MAETVYEDSAFRFTDPIRVFKANDPYYFEVDNIPLAQLQENCLWLKDQLTTKVQEKLQNIKRSDLDELKPYSTGGDRKVRVKPGRYTARVNDVASKKPLQYLQQTLGLFGSVGQIDGWGVATNDPNGLFPNGVSPSYNALLSTALDNFKETAGENALHMNGLAERAFTWPVVDTNSPVNNTGVLLTTSNNQPNYISPFNKAPLLSKEALLWARNKPGTSTSFFAGTYDIGNQNIGFGLLPKTESQWVKKWRGVARTAIVDIPNELSIDIPAYDANDFYYTDAQGNKVPVVAQNRIDMVFIYSKPVDASSTSTLKNLTVDINGKAQPTVITKAELGVVRGAGIGPSFQELTSLDAQYMPVKSVDAQGNQMIVPSVGDQEEGDTYGFLSTSGNDISQPIKGSFPAPDDIMNIAPLLSEKLESDAVELIGQSILPVAYVFVTNPGSEGVTQVVLNSDIIDIRPFFRTTELAYNERTGIAGAMPQLSLANPAVGKAELDTKVWELKKYIDGLHAVQPSHSQDNISTLAAGYVFGGTTFGPEATLADYYTSQYGSYGKAIKYVAGKYGFGNQNAADTATGPVAFNLPALPQWDQAKWVADQGVSNPGKSANDYITIFANQSVEGTDNSPDTWHANTPDESIVAGSKRNETTEGSLGGGGTRLDRFGNQSIGEINGQGGGKHQWMTFGIISKRIYFERGSIPWLADYLIDIQFINCLPQTYFGSGDQSSDVDERKATYTGWWVEKGWDYFTIYISVAAPAGFNDAGQLTCGSFPNEQRSDNLRWSNFLVMTDDIMGSDPSPMSSDHQYGYQGNVKAGMCTLPTIMWKVTGIPMSDNANFYPNLDTTDPIIQFKNS